MAPTAAVEGILDVVAEAGCEIRDALPDRRRTVDAENPSGDRQLAADVWADRFLEERLTALDGVGAYASEERADVVDAGDGVSVVVDPLDGSKNLKSNNAAGTIVGVYDDDLPCSGRSLVAAAFVLYGATTTMTVARDGTVVAYQLADGEREVVTPSVELPEEPTVYGFGGCVSEWHEDFASFAHEIQSETELKTRYSGAMVADVNQVLTFGGIFSYPALASRPEGKIRVLFEAHPMAYIVETAGGRASTGSASILDVEPAELHERTPVHVGNETLVEQVATAR